ESATNAAQAATSPAAAPPTHQDTAAASQAPPAHGGGFGGLLGGIGHLVEAPFQMLGQAAGYEGHGTWDRDRLMPFLAAIGAAGATPTVHPLFALSQGLGAYGKTYMAQQEQEAKIQQTQADAMYRQWLALPDDVRQSVVPKLGMAMNPDGTPDVKNSIPLPGGHAMHFGSAADVVTGAYGPVRQTPQAPQAGVSGSPGSGGVGAPTTPVTA